MIFYFTGTGNSRYIAKRIAKITSDEVVSINDIIKNESPKSIKYTDSSNAHTQTASSWRESAKLIFVLPTYAWRIPHIVKAWILQTEFPEAKNVWFVMNCGSEIGNAAKYNRELCEQKQWTYMGTAEIVMPENYIAMFNAPGPKAANLIISKAEPFIADAANRIAENRIFPAPHIGLLGRLMSGPVNKLFYSLFVKSNAFRAHDKCIGCGKCVQKCPLNNIFLQDGKPVWGKDCTHCMACICYCPTEAIEYGKITKGKARYHCGE